jgi:NitT/TauT family transport system substrate-binding protein
MRVMKHMLKLRYVVAICTASLALVPEASADDPLNVAVGQRGAWETAAAELGQQAGIFKKHRIVLDLLYASDDGEVEQRVISGGVDIGLGVNAMAVMRAYARGAPVRIIGATRTGDPSYWYVTNTSRIQTVKDIAGRTIAYATNGSNSHYDALDFNKQFRLKARLVSTGGMAATLQEVMSNHVDVGWATPPFGLDEIEQGKIRVVARVNDLPEIRGKTASVMITTADTQQKRKGVLVRFMNAYRETIDWMYSDLASLTHYAKLAGVSEKTASRMRQEFFAKDMLSPDKVAGLKSIIKDAVILRYTQVRLSRKQAADLVQIPLLESDRQSACQNLRADCTPIGLVPP